MMTKTKAVEFKTEELFSEKTGMSRGTVKVKTVQGRLFALIGSHWCKAARQESGKLIEVW